MGKKAADALEITIDDFRNYMFQNHSVYMKHDGSLYYLTDANDRYWRVQRTDILNEKGHYVDCSKLVPTFSEFIDLPFCDAGSISDMFKDAEFYASEK